MQNKNSFGWFEQLSMLILGLIAAKHVVKAAKKIKTKKVKYEWWMIFVADGIMALIGIAQGWNFHSFTDDFIALVAFIFSLFMMGFIMNAQEEKQS
jgi:ABC-type branched-subunit amino acid transport system permease subunit